MLMTTEAGHFVRMGGTRDNLSHMQVFRRMRDEREEER